MRNYRTVAIVLILVGLLSVPAQAQVIPGRWEKIEALGVGPPIIVDLKSGDRLEGKFAALSPSELSLRTARLRRRFRERISGESRLASRTL